MTDHEAGLRRFAAICDEAAQRHGRDWSAARDYVASAVSALPETERAGVEGALKEIVSFTPPAAPSKLN